MLTSVATQSAISSEKRAVKRLISSCRGSTDDLDDAELACDELKVREEALSSVLYLVLVNGYASLVVFAFYLVSIESLISIGLSVGMTVFTYFRVDEDSSFNGASMNWVLLSFAVITPISSVISMAFTRREAALADIARLRTTFIEILTAHAIWDWGTTPGDDVNSGRTKVQNIANNTFGDRLNGLLFSYSFFFLVAVRRRLA
jgi:hypothetical protein